MTPHVLDAPPGQSTILVVDDDPMLREMLADILGQQGYVVRAVGSGAEAVASFEAAPPDLVLLDVMMPGIDGFETCTRLRALDPVEDVPIIMVTGADDMAAIDRAFGVRATDFLTKPFRWKLLLQRVRYALRSGALRRAVRQGRQRDATALRIARVVFWEWRPRDDALAWSDGMLPLDGAPTPAPDDVAALLALVHPDDRGRLTGAFAHARTAGEPIELELRLALAAGERIVRVVGEPGTEGRDRDVVAGALQDITDLRKSERLAAHLALHDDLTGLGNRRWFLGALRDVLADATAADETVLVAWIDLTRFQRVNDALGAPTADALLRRFARRLASHVPAPALVARPGGDEFAVALRAPDAEQARLLLDALLEALRAPIALQSGATVLSFATGVAWAPQHSDRADALVALAEEALRAARTEGTPLEFASRVQGGSRSASEFSLERALRAAVDARRFSLAVQPQMDLHTGTVVGVECLLRWDGEDGTPVPPAVFVPILEETGLVVEVGTWVLEEACALQRRWAALGHDVRVGLNVSPRQFVDETLPARFGAILAASGVPAGRIELELTESLAMRRPEHTGRVLGALREAGALVAVDDFGVGHSSLAYLLRFPLDTIKIDRTFVTGITTNRANQAIVRAATAMAQSLGLTTIAEGVEVLREADFLDALGVREIQGWLVGRPMPAAALPAFLDRFTRPGSGPDRPTETP